MIAIRRRRRLRRRDRATRWSRVLRGVAVAAFGLVASLLIARGWQATVSRQRDERLDRTATTSRTAQPSPAWRSCTTAGSARQPGRQLPEGFRADGPDIRTTSFAFGTRTFTVRYAPPARQRHPDRAHHPGAAGRRHGVAVSVLLGVLLWLLAQVGALYHEVGRLARTDALTGVANRRAWDDEMPMELARSTRSGQPLCVALLDLDHFKAYNDRHGHWAGCARPTCWPATAGRSSRCCCPTAGSTAPWRSPSGCGPPRPSAPARSGSPPGTAARPRPDLRRPGGRRAAGGGLDTEPVAARAHEFRRPLPW
jgi:hypothetical protein